MEEEQNIQTSQAPVAERKGFNITSMILGIISLVCIWAWYVGLPCSIIAIIFSVAGKKDAGRGMGIAGLVLGIITLALYCLIFIFAMFITANASSLY